MRGKQLHTSLGVTGNTLHSGNVHAHKRTTFPPIVITGRRRETHPPPSLSHSLEGEVTPPVTDALCRTHENVTACVPSRPACSVPPPQCLHTSSLISSPIGCYGFGHPCRIPLATLKPAAGSRAQRRLPNLFLRAAPPQCLLSDSPVLNSATLNTVTLTCVRGNESVHSALSLW